jgi:hypothetical protein
MLTDAQSGEILVTFEPKGLWAWRGSPRSVRKNPHAALAGLLGAVHRLVRVADRDIGANLFGAEHPYADTEADRHRATIDFEGTRN